MSIAETPAARSDAETLFRLTDRLYRAQDAQDIYSAALDAITEALGCSRASLLLFDEEGVMRFVAARGLSEDYRTRLEGHTPWKPNEREPQPIFVSNIDDTGEPDWIKAAIRKEGIRALSFVPLVARGGCIGKFMTYYEKTRAFSPHDAGIAVTIARQVGFSIERARSEAARQKFEHDLRESEERFRIMSEHAPVMIWMSDVNNKCLHLNKRLRDFWGVSEDGLPQFDWVNTMHPEDAPKIGAAMAQAIAEKRAVSTYGRFRDAAGEWHVLQTDARPRFSHDRFIGMIGVNIDVTERDRAETARRQAEAHRELLIAELNHRVKNTLSVVQALAHQTFRGVADDVRGAFEGRLLALARAHDVLTGSNWDAVEFHQLAASALATVSGDGRVSLEGPQVMLSPRQALALGMALHELATNALKYGALSVAQGRVGFTWSVTDDAVPQLLLHWEETGGPPVAPPSRAGFGSVLLRRALSDDLNAEVDLDFRPAGLVCTVRAPLRPAAPSGK
jgi:PAS domain S-box-containing protein